MGTGQTPQTYKNTCPPSNLNVVFHPAPIGFVKSGYFPHIQGNDRLPCQNSIIENYTSFSFPVSLLMFLQSLIKSNHHQGPLGVKHTDL